MELYEQILSGISEIRERQRVHEHTLNRLADAVVKLAVIEERQASVTDKMETVVEKLDALDKRMDSLEHAEVLNKQLRYWGYGTISIIGTAVIYGLLRVLGVG